MSQRFSPASILIVEDKDSLRAMLRLALEGAGHRVTEASDQPSAEAALQERPALVLTDLRLGQGDGLAVLRVAKELDPDVPVVVMTAYGGVEEAVSAMKQGALDFLAKPVDPEHLLMLVSRALDQRRLVTENMLLKEELALRRGAPKIVGEDRSLEAALRQLQRGAASDATVLLLGESGTGKELFARTLHLLSDREEGPFVAINCAAIPEALLETELFGHEKGAFTGAVMRKAGKFEVAHRGTLFLDEIGDLPLNLQAKILRVLEERRFERLGGTATIQVDIRLVAATNRNLREAIAGRRFREDLFFRLSVFPIEIPALKQRAGDIPLLARYFVERYCRDLKKPGMTLSSSAVEALEAHDWPGNVRELQNCMERAVLLTDGNVIQAAHLNLASGSGPIEPDPWDSLDLSGTLADASRRILGEVERRKLTGALETSGDRGKAADALGLTVKGLEAKLRQCGLDR